MKKAVTVFLILTPVAFILWLAGLCFMGVMQGNFLEFIKAFVLEFKNLINAPVNTGDYIQLGLLGFGALTLLTYLIVAPARRRPAYLWVMLLSVVTCIPSVSIVMHYQNIFKPAIDSEVLGTSILGWAVIGAAGLTTVCFFTLWVLSMIELGMHPGKSKKKIKKAKKETVLPLRDVTNEPLQARPSSEPIEERVNQYEDFRSIIREEIERVYSKLTVRDNVRIRMLEEEILRQKLQAKQEPVKETVTEEIKPEPIKVKEEPTLEPEVLPSETVEEIVEEVVEEEEVAPSEEVIEEVIEEEVPEQVSEEPTAEPEEVEEQPVEEIIEEVEEESNETPMEQIVEQIVEEVNEEPVQEEVVVEEVVEEVKPEKVYERISFVQRMMTAEDEMKNHYNELKNEIMAYGVKSRVSSSGDAFRLHTKTYVKLTIAGKSLKLYFALDPNDPAYEKLPISDASNKAIYKEIPMVFKVKSSLSMKRAKELIADAMAKDNLEKGDVLDIDYVAKLEEDLEASFDDDEE